MTSNGDMRSEISLRKEWHDMWRNVDDETKEYIGNFPYVPAALKVMANVHRKYKQGDIKNVSKYIISAFRNSFETNDYDKEKSYFATNRSMPPAETTLLSSERNQSQQIAGVPCQTIGMVQQENCHALMHRNTLQSCDIQPEDQEPDSNEWRRTQSPPTSPDTPVNLQCRLSQSSTSSSSSLSGHLSKRFRQSEGAVCSADLHDLPLKPDELPCRTMETVQQKYFDAYVQKLKSQSQGDQADVIYQKPQGDEWQRMWYRATRTPKHQQPILKQPELHAKSCRFFRRWGSDRFLCVDIPNQLTSKDLKDLLIPFDLCGRTFKFFIFKRTMGSSRHLKQVGESDATEKGGYLKVWFFAEQGEGLVSFEVNSLRQWHFPGIWARDLLIPKYVARFDLGFSKTDSAGEITPDQIQIIDDLRSCDSGKILTDGCGYILGSLVDEVSFRMFGRVRRISALQIRLGPGKGMLCVIEKKGGRGIVMPRSMVKYGPKESNEYYQTCEGPQRELEIVTVVLADQEHREEASLCFLHILVLQACGVPSQVFVDVANNYREQIKSMIAESNVQLLMNMLPSPENEQVLCQKIWAMLGVGIDPQQSNYLQHLIHKYVSSTMTTQRKSGHLQCPDSYWLYMVPDWTQSLPRGKASLHIPGKGFLKGPHLLARVPCCHPDDIVLLEAVDDLRYTNMGYENLAVLSADTSQECSPASWMSGGDYDGDTVMVIGYRPIVEAVKTARKSQPKVVADLSAMSYGSYKAVQFQQGPLETLLQDACVQGARDAALMGKLNTLWMNNADFDLSVQETLSCETLCLAKLQELAVDSVKTGWTMDMHELQLWHKATPHWHKQSCYQRRHSKSAMGLLYDLENPEDWCQNHLKPIVGPDRGRMFVERAAELGVNGLFCGDCIAQWRIIYKQWKADREEIMKSTAPTLTYSQADEKAITYWRRLADVYGRSHEAFALYLYTELLEDKDCWDLCFQELCQVAAAVNSKRLLDKMAMLRSNAALSLRRASHGRDNQQPQPFKLGPGSDLEDLTRAGKLCKNYYRLKGLADGGDLSTVPRDERICLLLERIRFTHDTISNHFSDLRPISETVEGLIEGKNNLKQDFLVLDVVLLNQEYWSLRNRRLWVLKEFQRRTKKQHLEVSVYVLPLSYSAVLFKFLDCFSTQNYGESVKLKRKSETYRSDVCLM